MLIGEYIHTLDEKNRVSLPAKFRKEMEKKVIVTLGLDQCLFVFSFKAWAKVSKKLSDSSTELPFLKADQRSFNRYIFGRAAEVEVDRIGRILLPDFLKEKVGTTNKVAMIGVEDRIEIWNPGVWQEYRKDIERRSDQLAEKMAQR